MNRSSIIACALGLSLLVSQAWAFSGPEPTGFEKIKFGTPLDKVQKAYPKMKAPEPGTKAASINHPKIKRFSAEKVQLKGLDKPTNVDFQFWDGKFWLAQIHFGDIDQAKIDEYLKKNYGAPEYEDDNYKSWTGKTSAALMSKRLKTFEVHDEGMSNEARTEIFKNARGVQSSVQIQATPAAAGKPATAAATPAAAAPAPAAGGATPAK